MSQPIADLQSRLDTFSGHDRIVLTVDAVLLDAVKNGASDVHIEPTSNNLDIKFRVDGVLRTVASLDNQLAPNLVSRLKVMADLLTYRTDIPQEGGLRSEASTTPDMRVSTFPTVHGEKAVVRIFRASTPLAELDQLGLPNDIYESLSSLLQERSGALFLTGPSGSGKTTTIYACLRRLLLDSDGRHIVTVEDPVEQVVAGITQSQVRPGTEFDFARGLRSLLRQDPDVIMIGEIRDPETATVAIEAALTGHLVISTLHAGSAAGVVGRLLEMGVEPYLLTSSIRAILNQRLLRKMCTDCRQTDGEKWWSHGCKLCHQTGFRGRFLVAELLIPDAEFRRTILARADTEALAAVAVSSGMRSIRIAADMAVTAGLTTANEVRRVMGVG